MGSRIFESLKSKKRIRKSIKRDKENKVREVINFSKYRTALFDTGIGQIESQFESGAKKIFIEVDKKDLVNFTKSYDFLDRYDVEHAKERVFIIRLKKIKL